MGGGKSVPLYKYRKCMMELYIRIKNGAPVDHPILGENFRQVFPDISVEELPKDFARFERVQRPIIGVYEVYEGATYEWVNDIVKDVHHIRPMTPDEKIIKQEEKRASFPDHEKEGYMFDAETCSFLPKNSIGVTRV